MTKADFVQAYVIAYLAAFAANSGNQPGESQPLQQAAVLAGEAWQQLQPFLADEAV